MTIKTQKITRTRQIASMDLTVYIRHDDSCGNGHNTFAITVNAYKSGRPRTTANHLGSGCMHEYVVKYFPELAHLVKWHLCSTDGPMHYLENTIYLAGDKDCHGLRKGESRQLRHGGDGPLSWIREDITLPQYVNGDTCPTETQTIKYVPWCRIGEGKEPQLQAARDCAIWPDATLEQLTDKQTLLDRLPGLLAEFRRDVENLSLHFENLPEAAQS